MCHRRKFGQASVPLRIGILVASFGLLASQPAHAADPPDYECQPGQTAEENPWCCEGFDLEDPDTPEECMELPRTGPMFLLLWASIATAAIASGVALVGRGPGETHQHPI